MRNHPLGELPAAAGYGGYGKCGDAEAVGSLSDPPAPLGYLKTVVVHS